MNYYNWEKILKEKTNRELFEIYRGLSHLDNSVIPFAKKELKNRYFDVENINDTNIDWDYSPKAGCFLTLKKALKYLLIAGVNAIILYLLFAQWFDDLEFIYNDYGIILEPIRIVGLSLLSLVIIRIVISIINKKATKNLSQKKLLWAILITFTTSSYLYVSYSVKVFHRFYYETTRQILIDKIDTSNGLNDTKAENMTYEEYSLLAEVAGFKYKVPESAKNISFQYNYDGFLPDYHFTLTFEVPIEIDINIINYRDGDYTKTQTFEIKEEKKFVTYEELLM